MTPPPTSASASTITSSTEPPLAARFSVRMKTEPLTAVRVRADSVVTLPTGLMPALTGDWLISRGSLILAVASQGTLDAHYEILQEGGLHLLPSFCRALDDRLGPGTTKTAKDLLDAITRLASIKIGGVEVKFTPGQLDELAFRATKRGRTVQQEIEAVVKRLEQELFWGSRAEVVAGG